MGLPEIPTLLVINSFADECVGFLNASTTYNIALDGGACVRYQFIAEYPHPVASLSTRCSTKI